MARFSRLEVIEKFYDTGLVPVFFHKDINICKKTIDACYAGGVRVFEFTNRGDFAHEIYSALQKYVDNNFSDLALGAGSIIDSCTASLYIQSGANFIVSPILNKEMAFVCNRRKIMWSPGCGTLTEISEAESLGAEIVKIFPGTAVGGPGFAKAIKGPFPWTSLMPTGGVSTDEENLRAWFDAGVKVVGMGSKLIDKEIIENNDFDKLKSKVQNVIELIKQLKLKN